MNRFFMHKMCVSLSVFFTMNSFAMFQFEQASSTQKDFLVNFAVESNDIYGTRTVDRKRAEEIFNIPEKVFLQGIVEVLKKDDEIIGFFTLHRRVDQDQKSCELGHLYVKPGWQKKRIGSLLFDRAVSIAKNKGCSQMTWVCVPEAQGFYLEKKARITGSSNNPLNPAMPALRFAYDIRE